jgi:hypothetical protein
MLPISASCLCLLSLSIQKNDKKRHEQKTKKILSDMFFAGDNKKFLGNLKLVSDSTFWGLGAW